MCAGCAVGPREFLGGFRLRYRPAVRAAAVLSLFWFACFGALGVFFPLYSLYLAENLGLSGSEVGLVLAMLPLTGMFVQPLWGMLADRTGSRARILALLSAGSAAGYASLTGYQSFGGVLAGTAALALFSTSVLPMAVSVALAVLRNLGPHAFGVARSFGTLGYLIAVVGFPPLLHLVSPAAGPQGQSSTGPSEPGLGMMLWVTAAAMAAAALVALVLPRTGAVALRAEKGDWRRLSHNRPYRRLVVVVFLTYVFLQGPLALFPMFVRSLGGGLDVVSRMWLCMLVFEIPLLAIAGGRPLRLDARGLLGIGIGADALRWLVCALSPSIAAMYAVQVLHGVAVAGFVVGSALYVEAVVPGRLRSTGQSVVYMIGVSLGGIVSTLAAGLLLDHFGPRSPALCGGIGAALLAAALPRLLPRVEFPRSRGTDVPVQSLALPVP
ncbi:MAG: MFS transporter [Deltaproteobacteria bacterium]|nr:MFS transporter [Deltaproteobacteria bacterium]